MKILKQLNESIIIISRRACSKIIEGVKIIKFYFINSLYSIKQTDRLASIFIIRKKRVLEYAYYAYLNEILIRNFEKKNLFTNNPVRGLLFELFEAIATKIVSVFPVRLDGEPVFSLLSALLITCLLYHY